MLRHHDPGRMEDVSSEDVGKGTARSEAWPDVDTVVAVVSDGHVDGSSGVFDLDDDVCFFGPKA